MSLDMEPVHRNALPHHQHCGTGFAVLNTKNAAEAFTRKFDLFEIEGRTIHVQQIYEVSLLYWYLLVYSITVMLSL